MRLFHFSEEPDIQVFEPRRLDSGKDEQAMVWAIDDFHAPHYFLPRDCPRICIWPKVDTTKKDINRFFGCSRTERIIAVETGWLDAIRNSLIYCYTFDPDMFSLYDSNAGYYTSAQSVRPVEVTPIYDLLKSITSRGIEFRFTPSLMPFKQAVLSSTVNFSMIRLRNAVG